MAVSEAAALLDKLMGRDRNNAQKKPVHWKDTEFCEYFMVKFCPHDLFVNTRVDLGPCPKIHCENAKKQYNEEASRDTKIQYENMFVKFASSLLKDIDHNIRKGKIKLRLKTEKSEFYSNIQSQKNLKQMKLLSEQINGLMQKAEQMGTQGHVEEAQRLVKLYDQLKEKRDILEKQNEIIHWTLTSKLVAAKKKQVVCNVCGIVLVVGESTFQFLEHMKGRQHVGYDLLNKAMDEMQVRREKRHEEKLKKQCEEEEKKSMDLIKSYSKSVNRHSRNANNDKRSKSSRDRSCHRINRIFERHERERRSRSRSDCRSSNSPRHRGYSDDSCRDH